MPHDFDPTDPLFFGEELPASLHQSFDGRPFANCLDCGEALVAMDRPYAIQKVWRDGECIFEYAICWRCLSSMDGEMSDESRERLEIWVAEHPPKAATPDRCTLCAADVPEDADGDRVVVALAVRDRLLERPLVVCDGCHEAMEKLLSEKTRGSMDDFVTRHFPGVPAGVDHPVSLLFM